VSHLIASAKACDALLAVKIPPTADKLRRIFGLAQVTQSHALSLFHLSSPDLLLGMDADPATSNIFGVAEKNPELALDGIRLGQVELAAPRDDHVAAAALLAGGCLEVFTVNWATTMQQEIPPAMLSRLSSYDLLGSFALAPIGAAVAGPAGNVFGIPAVLAAGGILILLLTAAVLLIPEVRNMRRQLPAPLSPASEVAP